FWVVSSGRMVPGTTLITSAAAPRHRGRFMSINTTVQHLAAALAATVGAQIVGGGKDGQPLTNIGLVGGVAAVFAVLSVVLAGRVRPADAEPVAVPQPQAEVAAPEAVAAA